MRLRAWGVAKAVGKAIYRVWVSNELARAGAVASIIGVGIGLVAFQSGIPSNILGRHGLSAVPRPAIIVIQVSHRGPIWGDENFDEDEVVIRLKGKPVQYNKKLEDKKLIAFWRLANGFETNWHVARRRVDGDYVIAQLPAMSTVDNSWDFLAGGIEVEHNYQGDVLVVAAFIDEAELKRRESEWLEDEMDWGFGELPINHLNATQSNSVAASTRTPRRTQQ